MIDKIKGEVAKRFMMRGKMVVIVKMILGEEMMYSFRVTDKCNKKDYYSNDKYCTLQECERASMTVCKGI